MTQTSLTNKVIDKLKILNSGFSMNLTKVENWTVAVEFFAGADSTHKIVDIEMDRLENAD